MPLSQRLGSVVLAAVLAVPAAGAHPVHVDVDEERPMIVTLPGPPTVSTDETRTFRLPTGAGANVEPGRLCSDSIGPVRYPYLCESPDVTVDPQYSNVQVPVPGVGPGQPQKIPIPRHRVTPWAAVAADFYCWSYSATILRDFTITYYHLHVNYRADTNNDGVYDHFNALRVPLGATSGFEAGPFSGSSCRVPESEMHYLGTTQQSFVVP